MRSGAGTKARILAAAERLFAEFGIEAVSARQIAMAAGQRNQSAITYHFGSKEALIETLHTARMAEINGRRREMLAEIEQKGRTDEVRAWIEAIAVPLAEHTVNEPGGGDYVRFLAHLFANRRRRDVLIARGQEATVLRRIFRTIQALDRGVPEPLWGERLRLVIGGIINALAARERSLAAGEGRSHALPDQAFVSNLIDASVAALIAPCSKTTLSFLAVGEQRSMEDLEHDPVG